MNDMDAPKPELVLGDLADGLSALTPDLRKAAAYVLENPNDVGVSSIHEIAEAISVAREQGVKIVAISDSPASPIVIGLAHRFVVAADTPQFLPSSISTIALLETLLSFVVAVASPDIVERVEKFHARRRTLGVYEAGS